MRSFLLEELAYVQTTLVYARVETYENHSSENDKRKENTKDHLASYNKYKKDFYKAKSMS